MNFYNDNNFFILFIFEDELLSQIIIVISLSCFRLHITFNYSIFYSVFTNVFMFYDCIQPCFYCTDLLKNSLWLMLVP